MIFEEYIITIYRELGNGGNLIISVIEGCKWSFNRRYALNI